MTRRELVALAAAVPSALVAPTGQAATAAVVIARSTNCRNQRGLGSGIYAQFDFHKNKAKA